MEYRELYETVRNGLAQIVDKNDLLTVYEKWKENENNRFDSIIKITNPFDLNEIEKRNFFDMGKNDDKYTLNSLCMSVFVSEYLSKKSNQTFERLIQTKNRSVKIRIIKEYFELVDSIRDKLWVCTVLLFEPAEKQIVLSGSRLVDIYACYSSFIENLNKASSQSIFFLFSLWRITQDNKILKKLLFSIRDYIQTYFYEYDKDPDMHLYEPIEKITNIRKLEVILHWLEYIAFHTEGIFEEYKSLNWLAPGDRLADDIITTRQISKYQMYLYKKCFPSDDEETVKLRAFGYHGYNIWIKTVDIMYIVRDIFQGLYQYSETDLKKMFTSKSQILDLLDKMEKIRDFYKRIVFSHQVTYSLERQYYDLEIMNILEEESETISDTTEDVIGILGAVSSEDIESLIQSIQNYKSRLREYISDEQKEIINKKIIQVSNRINEKIQRMDVYDDLYSTVSTVFLPYAGALINQYQIYNTLVSAEYLFQQYIKNQKNNPKFDYSFISIMYYMSLEDFLNKLVYASYSKEVLSTLDEITINSNEWKMDGFKLYISHAYIFWDKKNNKFKNSCEIGVIGHLFSGVEEEIFFKDYISKNYPNIDLDKLKKLGDSLIKVSVRRNDSAHGGKIISYEDVCIDRKKVFEANETNKGLIMELMEVLFGKN